MGIRNDNITYQYNLMAALELMLRPQGATIKELTANIGVARSTAYDYINALSILGYPIREPERRGKEMVYHADAESIRKLMPLTGDTELTKNDRETLLFLGNATGSSALKMIMTPLLDKLIRLAPDGGITYKKADGSILTAIMDVPPIMKKTSPKTAEIASALISAIRDKQWIDIDYYSASKGEQKKMEKLFPIVCFSHDGGLYFYAQTGDGKLLTLAVERVSELKVIIGDNPVPEYSEEHIRELLSDPFGITLTEPEPVTVKLLIDSGQAYYYKELDWPDAVTLETLKNGDLLFTVRTRGLYELERWIMKNSPVIKVLGPDSVVEDIQWLLKATLKLYNADVLESEEFLL